jgi:hypothetical protein
VNSHYRNGRSPDWLKLKNPAGAAVKREREKRNGARDSARTAEAAPGKDVLENGRSGGSMTCLQKTQQRRVLLLSESASLQAFELFSSAHEPRQCAFGGA